MKKSFVFFLLLIAAFTSHSQTDTVGLARLINSLRNHAFNHASERIYLQLDKSSYIQGETIWFKAYNFSWPSGGLSTMSGVLYVDLINDQDSILTHLNLSIESGLAWGDITIPVFYKSGTYRIRAYTHLMINDGVSYFCDKRIDIGNSSLVSPTFERVEFFPEGGTLINGLRSKIAIKILDADNLGSKANGEILDSDDKIVAVFATNNNGMGVFALTPRAGKKYKAVIDKSDGTKGLFDLPTAREDGFTLSVNSLQGDSLYVTIAANEKLIKENAQKGFYLIAQSGGSVCYSTYSNVIRPVFTATIPKRRFRSGIVQFILFSADGKPLNERIIFLKSTDSLSIHLKPSDSIKSDKHIVKFDVVTKNSTNQPLPASLSVEVISDPLNDDKAVSRNDLNADFLIPAEFIDLAGHANDEEVDIRMLTEQYNKFDRSGVEDTIMSEYKPEKALSIEGFIKDEAGLPIAHVRVSLNCLTENISCDTITDKNGYFVLNKLDLSDNVKVFIKAHVPESEQNLSIYIKKIDFPKPAESFLATNSNKCIQQPHDSVIQKTDKREKNYAQPFGGKILKEVKIKSNKTEKQAISNKYGADDPFTISGAKLSDFSSVKMGLLGKLPVRIDGRGVIRSLRGSPMYIVLNNHEIDVSDIDNYVNKDNVESVKILRGYGYKAIYGISFNANYRDNDDIILITTKQYAGTDKPRPYRLKDTSLTIKDSSGGFKNEAFVTTDKPSNTMVYPFIGYYTPKNFSPESKKNVTEKDAKTIYWNPNIITDKDGKASFEFFNASSPGIYRVVVEGIDGYGNLGRQVYRYKVE